MLFVSYHLTIYLERIYPIFSLPSNATQSLDHTFSLFDLIASATVLHPCTTPHFRAEILTNHPSLILSTCLQDTVFSIAINFAHIPTNISRTSTKMVKLEESENGKLSFNKLVDPNDSLFDRVYKRLFRYAAPNLFIWGSLAPAHDALLPRATMACIQLGIGAVTLYGTFRRYSPGISLSRRRFSRLACLFAGSGLTVTALKELACDLEPNTNPLYIEIKLAREFSEEKPLKLSFSSYWNGPKNFMPMNNKQYWKMVYSLDLNQMMADQYEESDLMHKYAGLLEKFRNEEASIEEILTDKISDAVRATSTVKPEDYKDIRVPFELNSVENRNDLKSITLSTWFSNHPVDKLQLSEYGEYLDYEFPRMKLDESKESKS